MMGPPPFTNSVTAGNLMSGCTTNTPMTSAKMVPSFT